MKITLHGAAGEVTGSSYQVQTEHASVLVDFGLFQGHDLTMGSNAVPRQLDLAKLDCVILTHAHLDHTGRLPLLAKQGYKGPVYATPASIDLTKLILEDSAKLQEQDAERVSRKRVLHGRPPVEPLYTSEDAAAVFEWFQPLPYVTPVKIAPGISVRMYEAGHILGAASIEMTITEGDKEKVVVFSGDIGPRDAPILRNAACLAYADLVLMESTYGDRDHRSMADTIAEFRQAIMSAVKAKGKILIPTFAVGRAQVILLQLARMMEERLIPTIPVILDSPMAIAATRIHASHPELFDEEMTREVGRSGFLKHLTIRNSVTADDSRALNDLVGPCVILAGAGMCDAGRIVHHLRHNLSLPGTVVMIVGYQSPGSLGRRLVEGEKSVNIFGEPVPVRAAVHSLGGFSAHAGQTDLLEWFGCLAPKKPRLVLTHGEDRGRIPLAAMIEKRFGITARLPFLGEVIDVLG